MGVIKDFLFGRKVKCYDQRLGEFETEGVRGNNPSKIYRWFGEHQIERQTQSTFFAIEGNYCGLDREQRNSVLKIIDSLDEIISQVDNFIKIQPNTNPIYKDGWTKNWTEKFYLSWIRECSENEMLQFEIFFEPVRDDDSFIELIWNNGKLIKIDVR